MTNKKTIETLENERSSLESLYFSEIEKKDKQKEKVDILEEKLREVWLHPEAGLEGHPITLDKLLKQGNKIEEMIRHLEKEIWKRENTIEELSMQLDELIGALMIAKREKTTTSYFLF